ncbi:MAG: M3 family oligoendopeptidase [Patescibacteria group bacterium]|jgi:oligoendopeptidase F
MKQQWNLDDIVKAENFDQLYRETEREIEEIDNWIRELNPEMSEDKFVHIIEKWEELGSKLARLSYRPHLMEAVDQKDQKAKQMKSRVDNLVIKYSERIRKISHWIKGKRVEGKKILDDNNANRLFGAIEDLEYELKHSRLAAKHNLEEKEENIITNKDVNGVNVLVDLRSLIDSEFEFEMEVGGEKKLLKTQAELLAYVYSPKPEEREAAYRTLLAKYKSNIDKFFSIYQAVVKDWGYEAKLRGFKTPIEARNFSNRIPNKAVEVLLDVCRDNRGVFQEYFKYKTRELGVEKLKRFDIYAPLLSESKVYDYEQAQKLVISTFSEFSKGFADRASEIIENKHIDSHPKPLKSNGAFCATVEPRITPYVMLNYTGKIRDISTLAHELGHGVHSLYANNHHYSTQHANLPLAETASTLGEMVLFERLYEMEKDKKIKKSMLSEKLADSYASILRQNYFVIFEKKAHEMIPKGITADELSQVWLETLEEQFEESVEVDSIFKNEWAYIPHIVSSPFYCYAYNFGELLSFSLYARYKNEGRGFVVKIENILEAGGSKDPQEILRDIGVDMTERRFWEDSFEIIKGWMDELKLL